jgi:hypothetical protein
MLINFDFVSLLWKPENAALFCFGKQIENVSRFASKIEEFIRNGLKFESK